MPNIECRSFIVGDGPAKGIARMVAENGGRYCDDPAGAIISDVEEGVELLRWQDATGSGLTGRFRIDSFPSITLVWQQVGTTAALAYQLRKGKATTAHLILSGRDIEEENTAIDIARRLLGSAFPADCIPSERERLPGHVLYVKFTLRQTESDKDRATLLGVIAIVPIFCELCGIE